MTTNHQARRAAACLTLALLAAAGLSACERRSTDPQVPSTTAPTTSTTAPAEPAMPPASAASQ